MSFVDFLFSFLSVVACLSAVCVVIVRNPIVAVMSLILVFINVSMMWMLLGSEFLSLILVLVYVGAVMVMFLFVVMMIDIHNLKEDFSLNRYIIFGFFVGFVLVIETAMILFATWNKSFYMPMSNYCSSMTNSFSIGYAMYSDYYIFVEIGAVILLVGMISAIALTIRTRKDKKTNEVDVALKADPASRLIMVKFPKNINNYYTNGVSSKEGNE
ncbi:NADH-quinone oxidoreductase subunit J [Candidatus Kinetoplastidibacterium crithidiae]|uniref:NADH-quinone oxidoreductase subunit J n=1 Tax=Candidatus Kinetoplastidibacterium crithidiae TCC036E TaxID=1208918 RepID=M1LUK7_9PROT|nr:NADH-quinone oxidoreductase subunit J [Candidatus Kinetoplastibacterium crithidii]AFZ82562.1 NADH-ubiquinone oxidoreductase chain J [Candidatus Kinetoplastibacterium crithidii (ex Angomonas deanei ATCC 30255)]AGF47776.1 NADH dehydrogenase I subunit J [Candidatus Kinetoplastibacterium crithidii TCC036E]